MSFRLFAAFVILHSSFDILSAAPPPELTVLRTQYDKVVAERVTAPFEAALTELNTKYSGGLDRAIADAKATGRLEDILAIEAEKKRLAAKLPVPATDDEKEPESLKRFRGIYRQQFDAIAATRDKATSELMVPYTARLKDLEALLVKNDRVEEAKEVLAHRQGLSGGNENAQPVGNATATPPAPKTGPTSAPASKAKGDDRKAAEWVLSLGPKHRLAIDDRKIIASADQIPKGKFKITVIQIDGRYLDGNSVTAESLQTLAGLPALDELLMSDVPGLEDKDFTFLSTLPALTKLNLTRLNVTDGVLTHVAALDKLDELVLSELKNLNGAGLGSLSSLSKLRLLKIWKCSLNDAGLAAIPKLPSLRTLDIQANDKITDASLPKLQSLHQIYRLHIGGTAITPEGLMAAPMPNITHGAFNSIASKPMREVIPAVAKAFPKLIRYDIGYSVNTPEDLASLAHFPKLEAVNNWGDIAEEAWPGLAEVRSLRVFESNGNRPVHDRAFDVLAAMRNLKQVKFGSYKVPEDVLARFRKQRPDIKIN